MSTRKNELDSLKAREQDAFERKQAAFKRYADAMDRCNEAYKTMQAAWEKGCSAKEKMNSEYDNLKNFRVVWDEYGKIRDENNREIERLRVQANSEHQTMIYCFKKARDCYISGDHSPYWSKHGKDHEKRRDILNAEISRLCEEVKAAKESAKLRAPKTDRSAFRKAKEEFEQAKACHKSARAEFMRLKEECKRRKADFELAQAEYMPLKKELQRKLKEIKMANRKNKKKGDKRVVDTNDSHT